MALCLKSFTQKRGISLKDRWPIDRVKILIVIGEKIINILNIP